MTAPSKSSSGLPLILTLKLDQQSFDFFNRLRQQYFPPERNFLSAHVTLFHTLPPEQESGIRRSLQGLCLSTPVLSLAFPKLRFLGKGVAVEVDCPELIQLRQQLAKNWHDWLSQQDRQGYRPHITIQNKVTAEEARRLYDRLTSEWKPIGGEGEGFLLWHYQGGPWKLADQFTFN